MLIILYLAAQPAGTVSLDLEREIITIERRALERLGAGRVRVEVRLGVAAGDLAQLLRDVRPHVVHFGGHGRSAAAPRPAAPRRDAVDADDELPAEAVLLFELSDGTGQPYEAGQFAQTVAAVRAAHPELPTRLVVLNACHSEPVAEAVVPHVDFAIGMGAAVVDDHAIEFADGLYDALGAGATVEAAFAAARARVPASAAATPRLLRRGGCDPASSRLVAPLVQGSRLPPHHADDLLLARLAAFDPRHDDAVVTAYYRALPPPLPTLAPRAGERLAVTAARLTGDPERGAFPILKLVRLLDRVGAATAAALDDWARNKLLSLPAEQRAQLTARLDRVDAKGPWHLHLCFEARPSTGHLAMRCGLFDPDGAGTMESIAPDAPLTRIEDAEPLIVGRIAGLLRERRLAPQQVKIILTVPFDALSAAAFDQWKIDATGTGAEPLGRRSEVAVRFVHPSLRAWVEERWSHYLAHREHDFGALDPAVESAVVDSAIHDDACRFWVGPEPIPDLDEALEGSRVVALGLEKAALGLKAAVEAGIPIAVWARQPCDLEALKALFQGKLAELPKRVQRLRRRADAAGHAGHHITLLWDDPTLDPGFGPE